MVLPPINVLMPSPGSEAVRAHAIRHGVDCRILYGDIMLGRDGMIDETWPNFYRLLPFICLYHSLVSSDEDAFGRAVCELMKFMQMSKNEVLEFLSRLCRYLENFVEGLAACHLVAFSSKFHQWAAVAVVAHLIKARFSETKIYMGGQNTHAESKAMVKLCPDVDYFGWGEGEVPFLDMLQKVSRGIFDGNARTIARNAASLEPGQNAGGYVNLREFVPLQLDSYFDAREGRRMEAVCLERSRGCNWNKCTFCFLSRGYKFRVKPAEVLKREILHYIEKYGVTCFQFLDNDIVCGDISGFGDFLDSMIEIKQRHSGFVINMAELSPSGITDELIKKMVAAGFTNVQIGLETLSPTVIRKFNKKQSLDENLHFIRKAVESGMHPVGLNIIINYPDEEEQDIVECMETLASISDLIASGAIEFQMPHLMVAHYSRYMREVEMQNLREKYKQNRYYRFLHSDNITGYDRFDVFQFSNAEIAHAKEWKLLYDKILYYKKRLNKHF